MKHVMQTQFYVGRLGDAAEQSLRDLLTAMTGVESVEMDVARGRIVVEYSPDEVTPFRLRQAASAAGFHPSDVPVEREQADARAAEVQGRATALLKRAVGGCLFHACNLIPPAKRSLARLGMRTKKEWFRNRIARVQTRDGKNIMLASIGENYLSFQVFWKGTSFYEPITSLVLGELVWPGDTFVDVGANIGFFSLLLSAQKPSLRVVAFEPNPKNYELLTKNAASNGFRHLVCEPLALSDADGTAPFYLADSDMSASLRSDFAFHEAPPIQVKTLTLDSYLKSRALSGRLVLKVDVEGAEDAFFKGARETIAALKPDIITEVAVKSTPAYASFLREHGYHFYSITDEGLCAAFELQPVVRGNLLFLNYLLSARPPEVIAELFERIRPAIRKIDLSQTSKCVEGDHIHRALYGPLSVVCSALNFVAA